MRLSPEDVENSVYNTKSKVQGENIERNPANKVGRQVNCYTVFGHHNALNDEGFPLLQQKGDKDVEYLDHAYAKEVTRTYEDGRENAVYYVKRGVDGRFLNPYGIDEGKFGKNRGRTGMKEYTFREVNHIAFRYYLQFLKTKNVAFLKNAERETF